LVGESGSGKTTVAKLIMRALETTSGKITLNSSDGMRNVVDMRGDELMRFRRKVQMIFQDPYSSLNPRMTIQNILAEPFTIHGLNKGNGNQDDILDLLKLVGLEPFEKRIRTNEPFYLAQSRCCELCCRSYRGDVPRQAC